MRRSFFFGFLALAAPLCAESSVWKVSRGNSVFYLGGTCHVLRASDYPLPAEFDLAYAASARLLFETDVARVQSAEMQQIVATEGFFTDGRTLESVVAPATWKAVQAYCAASGFPAAQARQMKPWLFTVAMMTLELQKQGIAVGGVDLHYFEKASKAGKKTSGLESFEHHTRFITRLGAGHENEMVAQSLEEVSEISTALGEMLAAWKAGDLAKLDEHMVRDLRSKYPSIYRELLADRNRAWLPELEALLKTPEIEFVLVGVGHMPGADGLLALLRAKGCTVEPLRAPAAKK